MKEAMDVLSTKILSRNLRHLASVTSHIHQRCSLGLASGAGHGRLTAAGLASQFGRPGP